VLPEFVQWSSIVHLFRMLRSQFMQWSALVHLFRVLRSYQVTQGFDPGPAFNISMIGTEYAMMIRTTKIAIQIPHLSRIFGVGPAASFTSAIGNSSTPFGARSIMMMLMTSMMMPMNKMTPPIAMTASYESQDSAVG